MQNTQSKINLGNKTVIATFLYVRKKEDVDRKNGENKAFTK